MSVRWFGDEIENRFAKAVMKGVVAGTEAVKTQMIFYIMNPPKTGVIYHRRGVAHQASAPGEKPANDTGNLVKNITTVYDTPKLSGTVNVSTEYARRLEYGFVGTDTLGRTYNQAPRPYARPALSEKENDIRQGIANAIRKEFT